MSTTAELGGKIYSEAASVGKVRAWLQVGGGSIAGIVFLVIGIYLMMKKSVLKATVKGVVVGEKDPVCTVHITTGRNNSQSQTWFCSNMSIEYKDTKGVVYHSVVGVDSTYKYIIGSPIDIYYDPENPNVASATSDDYHLLGGLLLAIGLLIAGSSWVMLWLTYKYNFIAAAGGASLVGDIFFKR